MAGEIVSFERSSFALARRLNKEEMLILLILLEGEAAEVDYYTGQG